MEPGQLYLVTNNTSLPTLLLGWVYFTVFMYGVWVYELVKVRGRVDAGEGEELEKRHGFSPMTLFHFNKCWD